MCFGVEQPLAQERIAEAVVTLPERRHGAWNARLHGEPRSTELTLEVQHASLRSPGEPDHRLYERKAAPRWPHAYDG
jgi:hypothetical protein